MGTLVDDQTPGTDRVRRERPRDGAASGEKREVDAGEDPGLGLLDRVGPAGVGNRASSGASRGEQPQRPLGERAVVQQMLQLLTDGARGADDANCDRG